MNILQIAVLAIVVTVCVVVIREYKPEFAVVLQVAATVLVVVFVFISLTDLIKEASSIVDLTNVDPDYFKLLIKALGISIIVKFAADTCIDCENEALASKVELAGKIVILSLAVPMIKAVTEFALKLLKG